ncbi:hypothetical protein [Rhizobium wenxiniae]|uniref:hypothetical protein n=1 Tax=Rhizobium wenxiniae TaxID=1737357 RepID=UPI003C2A0CCD
MIYTQEILDRKTGELVTVDQGDWITIAELATAFSVGRRRATTVLRQMDFLQVEGGGRDCRHRIADWVVQRDWGRRLHRKADKFPFDVISPDAVEWIKKRWQTTTDTIEHEAKTGRISEAREALQSFKAHRGRDELPAQMLVCWLADFFPDLSQQQISRVLDVTQQLVSRFLAIRSSHIAKAKELRKRTFMEPVVGTSSCVGVA